MKIGIIASSRRNLYASALLARLIKQGDVPVGVICAEPSAVRELRRHAGEHGLAATIRKVSSRGSSAGEGPGDARYYLSRYAAEHDLAGWGRPLDETCRLAGIPFRRVDSINSDPAVGFARSCKSDLLINAGGEIFRPPILDVPAVGMLNAHMAMLPAFRGMNVMEWSLLAGEPIGVTVHFVTRGIDTGEILGFQEIPVEPGDTVDALRAKSLTINVDLLARVVRELAEHKAVRTPQRPEDGRQYFVMHPRLRVIVERRLACRGT